ncbi:MAG: HYR-like domain-containing protein, partial [Limisphaerales bacterium]
ATDASGNSSSQVQHVTVVDTTIPVLAGIPADVTVQCDAVPTAASPTAADNCDPAPAISLSQITAMGSCTGNYILTRTWIATDSCGNSSSASQQITVRDATSPVLVGVPTDTTVDCNAVPSAANVTATDNCDTNATVSYNSYSTQTPTGPGHDIYILKRKWTVTDACGNSATAQQILTVAPIAPVITGFPPDVTYACTGDVPAADDNLISATDPCGGAAIYIYHDGDVITNATCANQYDIARAYHVTNICGIITSRTQHITVRDTIAPVISAYPADATLNCTCDLPAANDALITASDNCSSVTINHIADVTNNVVDSLHFDIQRTYTATDACGNQTSHTQTFHMNLFAPPFITITGAPYIQVSNANYVVHGTAGSTFPLAGVYYSLNGAAYQLASGTANWSAHLHLIPGTNTVAAYAIDNHSIVSTTAVATVFYSIYSKLTVQIRDWPEPNRIDPNAGTITPNLNGQLLEVGRNYTMTAMALGIHRFIGWSYSPALNVPPFETNTTLTFMMTPNLKLIARFETPFYHLNGPWSGLFSEPTPDSRSAGFITFNLPYTNNAANNGYYSGRILLDGTQYKFTYPDALFDTTGHSHLVVPRHDKSALTVDMDIDVINYTGTITGTVTTPEWSANLLVHRGWTNVGNAEFRRYTMAFPPVSGPTSSPNGWGGAATTNGPGGKVQFVGFVADGARIFAPVTYVSENLEYPLYGQLYGSASTGYQGSIWGWLTFSKDQPGVTGTLYWWRPSGISTAGYTGGFSNVFQVIGSPYTNFPAGTPEFGWTGPATASFYDGSNPPVTSTASVANTDRVTFTTPNTNLVALKVNRPNGLVNGTFLQPFVHKKIDPPFCGVILQNTHTTLGAFYTSTNAGAFTFDPN